MLSLLATGWWLLPSVAGGEPATAPAAAPLHAARVLAGEGYERRAILHQMSLPAGESIDLPVYLFRQNTYCFLLAGGNRADALSFAVCDDRGQVVDEGSYLHVRDTQHVVHLRPATTGRHHLRIVNLGGATTRLALTYCYR